MAWVSKIDDRRPAKPVIFEAVDPGNDVNAIRLRPEIGRLMDSSLFCKEIGCEPMVRYKWDVDYYGRGRDSYVWKCTGDLIPLSADQPAPKKKPRSRLIFALKSTTFNRSLLDQGVHTLDKEYRLALWVDKQTEAGITPLAYGFFQIDFVSGLSTQIIVYKAMQGGLLEDRAELMRNLKSDQPRYTDDLYKSAIDMYRILNKLRLYPLDNVLLKDIMMKREFPSQDMCLIDLDRRFFTQDVWDFLNCRGVPETRKSRFFCITEEEVLYARGNYSGPSLRWNQWKMDLEEYTSRLVEARIVCELTSALLSTGGHDENMIPDECETVDPVFLKEIEEQIFNNRLFELQLGLIVRNPKAEKYQLGQLVGEWVKPKPPVLGVQSAYQDLAENLLRRCIEMWNSFEESRRGEIDDITSDSKRMMMLCLRCGKPTTGAAFKAGA